MKLLVLALIFPVLSFASVSDIDNYLTNLRSFKATFHQDQSNGEYSEGEVLLKKPGKIKWNYQYPKKILILGNNKDIIYCDYELKEVTYSSSDSSAMSFMSKNIVNLKNDFEVLSDKTSIDIRTVIIKEKKESNFDKLELKFNASPLRLIGVKVFDYNQNVMDIQFSNIVENAEVKDQEFVFRNPNFFTSLGN